MRGWVECAACAATGLLLVATIAISSHTLAEEPPRETIVQSTAWVGTANGVVSVSRFNRTFDLAGPDLAGRKADERFILGKEVKTTEVLGEKGMDGHVRVSAWPLDADPAAAPPLYVIEASGRDGRVIDNDLYVIERGLEEIEWQSAYSLANGSKLFDTTAPMLLATIGGSWAERRYVALAHVFDDAPDAALRRDNAVALLTYSSRTNVLDQVLIRAESVERARALRSLWDQTATLGWRGKAVKAAAARGARPDAKAGKLSVAIEFAPDGAELNVPLGPKGFDLKKATLSNGLALERFPPNLLLGRWTVTDARPAPWLAAGTDLFATVALFMTKTVEVGTERITSETPLACRQATYQTALVPPPGLFQGALAADDAPEQAAALGLSTDETRSVALSCDTGVYDFHFPARETALLAFDNVIFTLSRSP